MTRLSCLFVSKLLVMALVALPWLTRGARVRGEGDVTPYDEITKVLYAETWETGSTYDCAWICPSRGYPWNWCVYNGDWWKPSVGHKKCGCKCNANTDMTQCQQLHLEAPNGCTADYNQTDEIYGGRKIYRSKSKVLWYDASEQAINNAKGRWVCSNSAGSGNDASCGTEDNHVLSDCSGSGFKVTSCKSLFRKDGRCGGDFEADNNPGRIAICNMESKKPCCNYDTNTCGGSEADCFTSSGVNYALMQGSCSLEEVTGALRNIDECDITPIDHVDRKIWKEELWNIGGVILGNVPVVGPVFDFLFAMWDPISPIDNPWGLTDGLADAVNEQVASLQKCMDQKIFGLYVDQLEIVYSGVITEMARCATLSGSEKVTCVDDVLSEMLRTLPNWTSEPSGDYPAYMKYEEMLPIYQVAVHLWMTISGGSLGDFHANAQSGEAADLCNFNAALDTTKYGTGVFKEWIQDSALASLKKQLTPPDDWDDTNTKCTTDIYKPWDDCYSDLEAWRADCKGTLYGKGQLCNGACMHPECDNKPEAHSLVVHLRMTKSADYWCTWRLRDPSICDDDQSSDFYWPFCDEMQKSAAHVVANLKYDVNHFFSDQFEEKFFAMLLKWEESLNTIPEMECDKSLVKDVKKLKRFLVPQKTSSDRAVCNVDGKC